jgi:glutamate-1-semialdehyde 2,1-aminomutase
MMAVIFTAVLKTFEKGENMVTDQLAEEYKKTRPKSGALHERAVKVFGGDGATAYGRILDPYRPYITHAKGSKKWDVDGHEYIDYVMGHGALLLGHSHPAITKAVKEQVARGVHYGDNHELEVEWAELIKSMLPSAERVEFFSCGQEANLMAITLSRVFTGRKKILRFAENYHGWADELMMPVDSPGIVANEITILPYDMKQVEKELATREYAILMTEGGGAHMGQVPIDFDFVRALPALAHQYGTLWHLDEVVTGFRDSVGSFQTLVGVKPNLTSLGKIIGGGLGVGALAGGTDIMGTFSLHTPEERRVKHFGTWNANPLTSAAGIAALKLFKGWRPQKRAAELAGSLREKANRVLRKKGIHGRLYGSNSILFIYIGPIEMELSNETLPPSRDVSKIVGMLPVKVRLSHHLLQRGVSTMSGRLLILSFAHSEKDIEKTVSALADSFGAMIAEGSIKR